MPTTEIRRVKSCIHITVILCFHLEVMSKFDSQTTVRLKLVKLDCIIIELDLDTIKKASNKLDGACGLSLALKLK